MQEILEIQENPNSTILVVEDDNGIATMFFHLLTKAGFNVVLATDGKIGFEMAKDLMPDIIVSDINMPGLNGFEFRKLLLKTEKLNEIPFVFLTSMDADDSVLEGYNLDIEDYIIKTSSPRVIVARITSLLRSSERKKLIAKKDLRRAADTMASALIPEQMPEIRGFEIGHWAVPYKNIPGGDFIDYYHISDKRIAIVLGDVMGKKWNAWYYAVAYAGYIRGAVRFTFQSSPFNKPSEILHHVNESIYHDQKLGDILVSLSLLILDSETTDVIYSGAGDLPILHVSSGVNSYKSGGPYLGLNQISEFRDIHFELKHGEHILLFTDGITESRNKEGEMYGKGRVLDVINKMENDGKLIDQIKEDFIGFTANKFDDDVTLIVLKRD